MPLLGLSPELAYATKKNIAFPGTSTQATAAEARGVSLAGDMLGTGVTLSIAAGTIKVAS